MKKLLISATFFIACLLLPVLANAQYTKLTDFTGNGAFTGAQPVRDQNLIEISGVMYGMTANGGANDKGVYFKIMPDGTGYTKIFDFGDPGMPAAKPYCSFYFDGTWLYATSFSGGTLNGGSVFKMLPDGTSYTELHAFAYSGGGICPSSTLVSDGTYLYGMNAYGGAFSEGGVFRIMPDGTNFTSLYEFTGGTDGGYPYGSLTFLGGYVYGMTNHAGANDKGVVFKLAADGSSYSTLLDFNGANGSAPEANSFYYDGTFLYSSTPSGGTYDNGVIFKMLPDGTAYTKLFDFQNTVSGSQPSGHFIYDGTYLYATTTQGGASSYYGSAFKIRPDGTGFATIKTFDGYVGNAPHSYFISDGTYLYSMTTDGGAYSKGIIYKLMPDGSNYTTLYDFAGNINGNGPHGNMAFDGTYLYGTTFDGGPNNEGVIYKMLPDGTGYTVLYAFNPINYGYNPTGSLYFDGTYLYGTTAGGGSNYNGALFRMLTDGTGYTLLYSFNSSDGTYPGSAPLAFDGTYFYGTTNAGGDSGYGTAYKIMPDGSNFTKLHDFDNTNGNTPNGLESDGTALYGMTYSGGANNYGIIYKMMPDGSGFTNLMDFNNTTTGANPGGALKYDGTSLYGMAEQGGTSSVGTLFKIQPDGTGFTVLVNFDGTNGQYPRAGKLLLKNGYMYGMTGQGGTSYRGTIFKIKTDGTDHTILHSFVNGDGNYPDGSLITDGTSFYGTTYYGGSAVNAGAVFKICPYATTMQSPVLCHGESITVGGNTYSVSGSYSDTIHAVTVCDSIVTTNLTILGPVTGTVDQTVCDGTPVTVGGTTYAAAGTYTQSYPAGSINGCDSTLTINITYLAPLDASVNSDGVTIALNEGADAYQWVDCNNGNAPIAGETNYSFTPSANGDYAVVITVGSCTATSACTNITMTGIAENTGKAALSVYPNPNTGTFAVKANAEGTYVLVSSIGTTLQTFKLTAANNYSFKIDNLQNGIYFIKNDKGTVQQKVVVAQ